jgi:GntR family transcriptional regulator, transcriptional repressor for pyruvate dehydrogenase complex
MQVEQLARTARPPKTSALVAAELRRRIATGELQPGDRLPPEDGLMEEFDLARTTLREALRVLESEGLITVQRGRNGGPRVTSPPVDRLARMFAVHLQLEATTLGDLDDARQLIESHLAAHLAEHHTDEDIEALEDAIAAAAIAARSGDREAFGVAAAGVHETLVERAGNQTLALIAKTLHEVVEEFYRLGASSSDAAVMERAVRSYRKLRRLIEVGDAEGAAAHWRRQMSYTISGLGRDRQLDVFRR